MITAYISGQAHRALALDGEHLLLLDRGQWSSFAHSSASTSDFLRSYFDVEAVDCRDYDAVAEIAEEHFRRDQALQLILVLLEPGIDIAARREIAECASELLTSDSTSQFVANRLYSAPLPELSDIAGALRVATNGPTHVAHLFLSALAEDQERIRYWHLRWLEIARELFSSGDERHAFYNDLVVSGAFHLVVTSSEKRDSSLFQLLAHSRFRGQSRAREVLWRWLAPTRDTNSPSHFGFDTDSVHRDRTDLRRDRFTPSRVEIFQSVSKQKDDIKELIRLNRNALVLQNVDRLVSWQRAQSERSQLAMTLCDLAQYAKRVGDDYMQRMLARRAVAEVPEDAWSHAQLADAFRQFSDYSNALTEYQEAARLGDSRVALLGQAEIFKDLGNFDQALALVTQAHNEYPGDIVAINALASLLATTGRFEDALAQYDHYATQLSYDVVTLNGRASVLRQLGRFNEAREQLYHVLEVFPDDVVTHCALGEVLRDEGQLESALAQFATAEIRFPHETTPFIGRARVLRDLGRFDESVDAFERFITTFPASVDGYIGIADTLRRAGELDQALKAYEEVQERFPHIGLWRTGKATIFSALGRFEEAIGVLPIRQSPASRGEWIAYHVHAMSLLRQGNIERALEMMQYGYDNTPWLSERPYFATALAAARLRQKRYREAAELASSVQSPVVDAVARVIEMHAYGELGIVAKVRAAYTAHTVGGSRVVREVRDELAKRFMHSNRSQRRRAMERGVASDEWLFEKESVSLLLAA
jgi:Flp pilus assembly protein TadD, contains TPR repeats